MDERVLSRFVAGMVKRMTEPLARRIRLVASRGTITATSDESGVQTCQVTLLSGERISDVQILQLFGSSGRTPVGATCVVLSMGGSRSHPVVIAVDDPKTRFRNLEVGEWVAYNSEGDFIRLRRNHEILINSLSTAKVTAPAGSAFEGNVTTDQSLAVGYGASGTFTTPMGQTVTVRDGIVTNIY